MSRTTPRTGPRPAQKARISNRPRWTANGQRDPFSIRTSCTATDMAPRRRSRAVRALATEASVKCGWPADLRRQLGGSAGGLAVPSAVGLFRLPTSLGGSIGNLATSEVADKLARDNSGQSLVPTGERPPVALLTPTDLAQLFQVPPEQHRAVVEDEKKKPYPEVRADAVPKPVRAQI